MKSIDDIQTYNLLLKIVLVIIFILLLLEFGMENMKNKMFFAYQYIKWFEIRFLVLVYVTVERQIPLNDH